jgi:HEAT repeat protein
VLVAGLKDKDEYVRTEAAFTLGLMGKDTREATASLRTALKDPCNRVRLHAAHCLLRQDGDDREAAAALLEAATKGALPRGYPETRIAVLRAMAEVAARDRSAVPALREIMSSEPHRVWVALADVLKKVGISP